MRRVAVPSSANPVDMNFVERRPRLTGTETRRLLELREFIKIESLQLPRALQQELLSVLEGARPRDEAAPVLPEMSRGELIRAIRWRVGTLPLAGAVAGAEFVTNHRRRRGRSKRSASTQAPQDRRKVPPPSVERGS